MFDEQTLKKLREVYNSQHSNEIPLDENDIWNSLKKRLHKKCKDGKTSCIISQLLNRPKAPKTWITNPEEWLSSTDIENLEKQYEKLFPTYKFAFFTSL